MAPQSGGVSGAAENSRYDLPDQYDWLYRPQIWKTPHNFDPSAPIATSTDLGDGTKFFHDGPVGQLRYSAPETHAGVRIETEDFQGSFVSVVQDLPELALRGLGSAHFLAVHVRLRPSLAISAYGRLNVRYGPNQEQLVREFIFADGVGVAEFDLAYSKIKARRVESAWIDVIFKPPATGEFDIVDLILVRAPRADI
jgi:hypothetical protein